MLTAGAHPQLEPLSPTLSFGVNPFPSRFINRTALRGGFARPQFKEPIKTELKRGIDDNALRSNVES